MENYNADFYAARGISPGVAEARGYLSWTDDNYETLLEEVFPAHYDFACMVASQGPGIAFPRHPPTGYEPITAGLRPNKPVELGAPQRHFHGTPNVRLADLEIWHLLPAQVSLAYTSTQPGRVKVYFEHVHDGDEIEHIGVWHPALVREGQTPLHKRKRHGHVFYVYEVVSMRGHIAQDLDKGPDSHGGDNPEGIHTHQKRAKYLYTPSDKEKDVPRTTNHDHEKLKGSALTWHRESYHNSHGRGPVVCLFHNWSGSLKEHCPNKH